jgi:class 3 adenylate cyclase
VLTVRVGVHTEDAVHRDGDYYGVAVNKAARIAGIAAGGAIVVSAVTAELSGGQGMSFGPSRTVSLKGFGGVAIPSRVSGPMKNPVKPAVAGH